MKLLVRNLSRETTEVQLRALFAPFGAIQSCNLILDKKTGTSKGFGFVDLPKPGAAKAAMKSLNNTEVDGLRIRVKKAEERPEPTDNDSDDDSDDDSDNDQAETE